jgi:hypothetical protein
MRREWHTSEFNNASIPFIEAAFTLNPMKDERAEGEF